MALTVRPIGREYNEEMLRILLESPMESDGLTLVLDRTPDMFLVAERLFKAYQAYGFFMDDRLVGYGMICEKELYVNGRPRLAGYFANLYVKREARKLGWLYRASAPLFEEITKRTSLGFATTVKGNKATVSMIGRKITKFPLMPFTRSIGFLDIKNILVTFRKREQNRYVIRRATEDDLPDIAALLDGEYRDRLFGPLMSPQHLRETIDRRPGFTVTDYYIAEDEGQMVGVCSAWDIHLIRKIRVMAYRKTYRWVYRIYKLIQPLTGFPRLPKPGEPFRELVINDFATRRRDPAILQALITRVYNDARKKGYNMVQIGSYQGDPMLAATRRFFTQPLISHIILGSTTGDLPETEQIDLSRPFVDIALT